MSGKITGMQRQERPMRRNALI